MAQNDQNDGLQIEIPGMDQFKDLKFLQSETNPTDLIVQLPDGSEVVFPNYIALAQAGAPPEITLEDGTVIPGQEIVSLIDNLNYDLIAPAAGNEGESPNGGGAGFSTLELDPDDDIGHGPYANQIEITDDVGFDQYRGYLSEDGSGEIPVISRSNNVGDDFEQMMETSVGLGDRPVPTGPFAVELETFASEQPPVLPPPFPQIAPVEDWDGMAIYLREGETVTINHHVSEGVSQDPYYVALGLDPSAPANDPLVNTSGDPIGWEYYNFDGLISYVAESDGWVYVGTGFPSTSTAGAYYTEVLVDDDNILVGTEGNDIFDGGARDEQYIGGAGSDRFVFTDATTDGDDTIRDFETTLDGATENDVIDLDALFDSLGVADNNASREVLLDTVSGNTILTIGDGSGGALAGAVDFSITLNGVDLGGFDYIDLINNGNLEVT